MPRTLFTADLHFGHANVIKHCARPFATVEEMDRSLIELWNSVVAPADDIYVVGDFAYKCDPKRLRQIFEALHGRKRLILGNHDLKPTVQLPWMEPPTHRKHLVVDGTSIVLDHYAGRTWYRSNRGSIQLFGHSHGRLPGDSQSLDVGVDCWNYMPVDLPAIQARLATLPPFHQPDVDDGDREEPESGFTI